MGNCNGNSPTPNWSSYRKEYGGRATGKTQSLPKSFLKPGYTIIHQPEDKWPKPLEEHIEMEDAIVLGTCTKIVEVMNTKQEI